MSHLKKTRHIQLRSTQKHRRDKTVRSYAERQTNTEYRFTEELHICNVTKLTWKLLLLLYLGSSVPPKHKAT